MSTVREAAARWFVRMHDAAADHPDRRRFEAWLAADPSHPAEYAAFGRIWAEMESAPDCDSLADAMERRRTRRRVLKGGALGLLFVALAGEGLIYARQRPGWEYAGHTAPGEVQRLVLPDGSVVMLGADSGIEVGFSRAERHVRLDKGEASFDVVPNAARPFVVEGGEVRITVLGTRFAVARLNRRIRVSLDHGRVRMETGPFWRRRAVQLEGGQVAEAILADGEMGPPRTVDRPAAAGFAFEGGAILFEQAGLAEIADTLSRYRSAPVRARTDEPGGGPRVTAVVQQGDVDGFLRLLPRIAPVAVTDGSDGAIILSARPPSGR